MSKRQLSRRGWAKTANNCSVGVQCLLVVVGGCFAFTDLPEVTLGYLLVWCVIATAYAGAVVLALGVLSQRPASSTDGNPVLIGWPARMAPIVATILSSLVGIGAVAETLALRSSKDWGGLVAILGVWAMLLSWGLMHWGFAQIYAQAHTRSQGIPPLLFPATPAPQLVDFVYFSYTVGTSFAVSDVETRSSSIRGILLWHGVLSFFFNGFIIVLALNTLTNLLGS